MYYYKNKPFDSLEEAKTARSITLQGLRDEPSTLYLTIKLVEMKDVFEVIHPDNLLISQIEDGKSYKCTSPYEGKTELLRDRNSVESFKEDAFDAYLKQANALNVWQVADDTCLGYYDVEDVYTEFEPVVMPEFKEALMTDEELIAAIDAALDGL